MSTELVSSLPVRSATQAAVHPLAPLSGDEIKAASAIIQSAWPHGTNLHFKAVTLEEPPKAQVVPYLDAEHSGAPLPSIPRKAFINYYIRNTNKYHEAIIDLTAGRVERNVRLGANVHANGDGDEIVTIEKVALEDPAVQAEIAKLQLPKGTVVVIDPWIYGSDGVNDDDRMYQCFMYMRDPLNPNELDSNHYALPLPISPVISTEAMTVIRIDILPTGADEKIKPVGPLKIHPPNEYIPEAQPSLRTDLKPLNVVQPEGASFTVTQEGTSSVIAWQKWRFRVGFNQREGMVLYDVRYDNRSLFYRVSLSDMNIPYADPRHPFHKKSAFDLGDAGAGIMANNLQLGCDCLGHIYYLSSVLSDDKGGTVDMPNVVCIHEQDAGIGWKHTNYRTGRAAVVRNRELVLQSIITVSNYEYILAFQFNQAGELTYEVRATGILSTQPIDEGVEVPFGTVVHPGVLAVHHQHIFSLRIDPALEGHANRLVYDEAHPMPRSAFNPHGTGYTVSETTVTHTGGYDLDPDSNRVYKIINAGVRNPINNKPVAYKIMAPPFQKILSDTQSFNHARAEFSDHNIYLTTHRDGELYAGGRYTNQSRGGTGVRSWASRRDAAVDADIVVFVQFGINHVPRIEDFPVMPVEILKVSLKPVNFFDKNPALDVPPSEQSFNRSTSAQERHQQSLGTAVMGASGKLQGAGACCAPGSKL
ncbi:Copper amine oxidase [Macrophomina phaseolina MS6]|uniref:Amine oxidase n=1 Tax=Macrophomina phaseolina (strain MS6) TaxID=1126212 RepID=K2T0Z1_MACPH|nr:Copper amine oxidase [Macrophomina phaseolina MS6]